MVASADKRHLNHVVEGNRSGAAPILRAAAVYGANGHGKTRLVDALAYMKKIAVSEQTNGPEESAPHFKLDETSASKPTRFVLTFRSDDIEYEYGIFVKDRTVNQEWLYERERRQSVMLFEREINEISKKGQAQYTFRFGPKLLRTPSPITKFKSAEFLEFLGATIDSGRSFLSVANEHSVSRLSRPHLWIAQNLQIVGADSNYANLHENALKDRSFLKHLSKHIASSDTGIADVKLKKRKVSKKELSQLEDDLGGDFAHDVYRLDSDTRIRLHSENGPTAILEKRGSSFYITELSTLHKGATALHPFSLDDESAGTRRLLDLYPMLYNAKNVDMCYVVDELDRKLHPLLSKAIVRLFLGQKRSQLVFTTHNPDLLDQDILRRDEIWFVQKNEEGASELYCLNEFKARPDLDIRRGYLNGRFGAIPFQPADFSENVEFSEPDPKLS